MGVLTDQDIDPVELRFSIDSIDAAIAKLLGDRKRASHALQANRVRSGGARVDLSRESQIINSYSSLLGQSGRDVADAVLTYCRGEQDAADSER